VITFSAGTDRFYREILDQIVWGENNGFDDVWLSEHRFIEDEYLPSILPIAAAIAARTRRIRIRPARRHAGGRPGSNRHTVSAVIPSTGSPTPFHRQDELRGFMSDTRRARPFAANAEAHLSFDKTPPAAKWLICWL